jgi:hypothetical protein
MKSTTGSNDRKDDGADVVLADGREDVDALGVVQCGGRHRLHERRVFEIRASTLPTSSRSPSPSGESTT